MNEFNIAQYLLEQLPIVGITVVFLWIFIKTITKQVDATNKRLDSTEELYINLIKEKDNAISDLSKQKDEIIEKASDRIIKYSEMFKDLSVLLEHLHTRQQDERASLTTEIKDMKNRLIDIQSSIKQFNNEK